jgi:rhodanese-related sulfurtransferase
MSNYQIDVTELYQLIGRGLPPGHLIVDVRTPEEFSMGAIAGAVNIPLDQILVKKDFFSNYHSVYLFCRSGHRSEIARLQLSASESGRQFINVDGGVLAWQAHGYPLI